MRIVLTGATGNVGSAVLRALAPDDRITSVTGLARRVPERAVPGVKWVAGDVGAADLESVFAGADAVVHAAWLIQPSHDRAETRRANVLGSRRVFEAAAAAGVGTLVHLSSLAVYAPGTAGPVVESWSTTGIPTSDYSRDKVAVEQVLDEVERAHPEMRVVRLRPTLIFQRAAGSEIRRYFAGPFLPRTLVGRVPLLPLPRGLRFQVVHADDVADVVSRALFDDVRGAFNVAADPVIGIRGLASALGARAIPVPAGLLRSIVGLTWRARLQPTSPGWLDLAVDGPLLDATRARRELGWVPSRDGAQTLRELLDGLRSGAGAATPPLDPEAGGPARLDELRTGVGGRSH